MPVTAAVASTVELVHQIGPAERRAKIADLGLADEAFAVRCAAHASPPSF